MDLINQNKFKNWLIIVLLAINLLTVSIIWMQIANRNEPQAVPQDNRSSESVNLMKKVLDLDEGQTKQFEKMHKDQLDKSKMYNDRLTDLKKQLAEELFKETPDTSQVNLKAKEIGDLQSKIESIKFNSFKELLAICTPEQKEKLKPVLIELFGRKPPKEDLKEEKRPNVPKGKKSPRDKNISETERDKHPLPGGERPNPPSVDEKLDKYSQRLNLTKDQEEKMRTVLLQTMQKDEELRSKLNPDRNEIESDKEKIRKEEYNSIMKILNEDQKKEFARMILQRKK
ncbi:periplasmic heavy metal sensor [Clostridium sp.]|uniref:periplasmic heavy metal sensor n=1 Tax=Clostridium sp. TaxID=1506 RepID=UPI00283E7358|nr:periplasmic heavy metal sensor [Clostridium sp.]MDR3593257.1 periplasmic heavy metal sensor [Clostridium sp.]